MNAATLANLAAQGEFSPQVQAWLARGLAQYLAGDPLEQALGLTGGSRVQTRNLHLLEAAMILDDGRGLTDWRLAGELRAAILRRLHRGSSGDHDVDLVLQAAEATGVRPLRSRRRLYELLTNSPVKRQ